MAHHLFGLFDLFIELIEQILSWLKNLVKGLSIFDIHLENIINVFDSADGLLDVLVLLLSDEVNDFHDFVLELLIALLAQHIEAVRFMLDHSDVDLKLTCQLMDDIISIFEVLFHLFHPSFVRLEHLTDLLH